MIGERAVFLILAVIFFSIVVFVIFKIFPNLMESILTKLGAIEHSNIEKAILCSIYRCVEGCMSPEVYSLEWKEGDKVVKCADFCNVPEEDLQLPCGCEVKTQGRCSNDCDNPNSLCSFDNECTSTSPFAQCRCEITTSGSCSDGCENAGESCTGGNECKKQLDTDLRICGGKYPVNITLKNSEKIEKSHLKVVSVRSNDVDCIIPNSYLPADAWERLKIAAWDIATFKVLRTILTEGKPTDSILIIENDLIKTKGLKEDCMLTPSYLYTHDSYTEVTVPKKDGETIYIVTDVDENLLRRYFYTLLYK